MSPRNGSGIEQLTRLKLEVALGYNNIVGKGASANLFAIGAVT